MSAPGRPDDFPRVTARRMTADGHRVDVIAGADGNLTGSPLLLVRRY